MSLLLTALLACGGSEPAPVVLPDVDDPEVVELEAPAPPTPTAPAYALARLHDDVRVALPDTTRPGDEPAPATFAPPGAWTRGTTREDGVVTWETPLPVASNLFPSPQSGARSFGNYEPEGLQITLDGKPLRFLRHGAKDRTWGFTREHLLVGLSEDAGPPGDLRITWPKATAAEASLHLATSGLSPTDFALRTLVVGTEASTGLLLPAPARAAWTITVPEGAVLSGRATILPPYIVPSAQSQGARLVLQVRQGDTIEELEPVNLAPERWEVPRWDLSRWAGQEVELHLLTRPAGDATLDLVFFEEPTVYTPKANPRRVVVAFLDTVRRDHLGMYGYERATTPRLDAWFAEGARMDATRSVAPWTLPSARAALSGRQPEHWHEAAPLPAQLAAAGFHSEAIVANAYLSPAFDMHRGFSHYRYSILQPAGQTIQQALEVLERWPDRDVFLWVQFMEAHLPYQEPKKYRRLFADEPPPGAPKLYRHLLYPLTGREPWFPALRQHVIDRYDNNIRVLDDEVSRLFEAVGPEAVTMIFADHGEEFWDHGSYEHGHTFYDELLKVPLAVRAPSVPAGAVVDAPSSLLDLTPTVLELAGVPVPDGLDGFPLRAAMLGEADAVAALDARPQGFGRPLYGDVGWGVLADDHKWIDRGGRPMLFDVAADPAEAKDLAAKADLSAYPGALAEALDRETPAVWRVSLDGPRTADDVTVRIAHPDGVERAWKGYDPRAYHDDATLEVEGEAAVLFHPGGDRVLSTFYVQPKGDAEATEALTVQIEGGPGAGSWTAGPVRARGGRRVALAPSGGWKVSVDLAHAPVPAGRAVEAFHPELSQALEALGYLDPSEDDED